MNWLLEALGGAASAPGDYTRGLLAGRPGDRVGGRELLRRYGLAGEQDNWGNFAAGLATDVATDPLTWLGLAMGSGAATSLFGRLGPRFAGGAAKLGEAVSAGGRPAEMAGELLASPNAARLLGEIPEGAALLEGSNNALAFKTPAGDVLRMARGAEGAAPASRAAIPEVLQPTRNVSVGDWRVERVPFAERVGDRELYRQSYRDLAGGVRSAGGHPADLHPGNVGSFGGRPVIIDPGAVVPLPGRGGGLPLAPDRLGRTPGKYLYPGLGAGAGFGAGTGALGRALVGEL